MARGGFVVGGDEGGGQNVVVGRSLVN